MPGATGSPACRTARPSWSLQSWVTDSPQPPKAQVDSAVARVPTQGCLLFVDVDHLGMMNEVTSRDMGNKMLRHIGRLLHSHVQPLGDVARLGGDELARSCRRA